METGKYFEVNRKRLDSISDIDRQWAVALYICTEHIRTRLKKRTTFGAHTEARLGVDPVDYYLNYAYDAILSGKWEWKESNTLSEQMIRIADSTISTEVDKIGTAKEKAERIKVIYDDLDTLIYAQDPIPDELDMVRGIVIDNQIRVIEETIRGDDDLVNFWECVKEGMKRAEIIAFMEKTPKQIDKLRERFIKKIKMSPYFEMD